jgi:hypothetical protein
VERAKFLRYGEARGDYDPAGVIAGWSTSATRVSPHLDDSAIISHSVDVGADRQAVDAVLCPGCDDGPAIPPEGGEDRADAV